jgi:transposase-like protein
MAMGSVAAALTSVHRWVVTSRPTQALDRRSRRVAQEGASSWRVDSHALHAGGGVAPAAL